MIGCQISAPFKKGLFLVREKTGGPIRRPGLLQASCAALREPAAASIAQAAQAVGWVSSGSRVGWVILGLYSRALSCGNKDQF